MQRALHHSCRFLLIPRCWTRLSRHFLFVTLPLEETLQTISLLLHSRGYRLFSPFCCLRTLPSGGVTIPPVPTEAAPSSDVNASPVNGEIHHWTHFRRWIHLCQSDGCRGESRRHTKMAEKLRSFLMWSNIGFSFPRRPHIKHEYFFLLFEVSCRARQVVVSMRRHLFPLKWQRLYG